MSSTSRSSQPRCSGSTLWPIWIADDRRHNRHPSENRNVTGRAVDEGPRQSRQMAAIERFSCSRGVRIKPLQMPTLNRSWANPWERHAKRTASVTTSLTRRKRYPNESSTLPSGSLNRGLELRLAAREVKSLFVMQHFVQPNDRMDQVNQSHSFLPDTSRSPMRFGEL